MRLALLACAVAPAAAFPGDICAMAMLGILLIEAIWFLLAAPGAGGSGPSLLHMSELLTRGPSWNASEPRAGSQQQVQHPPPPRLRLTPPASVPPGAASHAPRKPGKDNSTQLTC